MHLFISDLFISIDTLAPVIDILKEKNKKVKILNINPVENFSKDKLYAYLKKRGVLFEKFLPVNLYEKIFLIVINFLKILPSSIIKKIDFFWRYIYKFSKFSSSKQIKEFLLKNKISSITYEETAEPRRLKLIFKTAKELHIPIIQFPAGVHTLKVHQLGENELKYCDYYIAPNKIRKFNKKYKNKILTYGSPRYSEKWISKLNKIYSPIKKKNKISIYLIKRTKFTELNLINELENKLKENKNYHVISNNKPRDYLPTKCTGFYENYKTTQLINWCDFIVSSRSSSVLLEGIKKDKKILLLKYLYPKISKSLLIGSNKNIFLIKDFKKMIWVLSKKENSKISKIEKNGTLKKFLVNYGKKNFKASILKIYQRTENYAIK